VKKYKCLVLDHDDTVVRSTPTIHYPAFVESLKVLRPGMEPYTLEEFVSYCFAPGFYNMCVDILRLTDEEIKVQQKIWRKYTSNAMPPFYKGFKELIKTFKDQGGYICVVSHSEKDRIKDYYSQTLGFEPELIYGWEEEEDKRKPHPFPLEDIMRRLKLKPDELLMVDDLKPGLDMARSAHVDFASAGWSHIVEEIELYMKANSDYYFKDVKELKKLVLN